MSCAIYNIYTCCITFYIHGSDTFFFQITAGLAFWEQSCGHLSFPAPRHKQTVQCHLLSTRWLILASIIIGRVVNWTIKIGYILQRKGCWCSWGWRWGNAPSNRRRQRLKKPPENRSEPANTRKWEFSLSQKLDKASDRKTKQNKTAVTK